MIDHVHMCNAKVQSLKSCTSLQAGEIPITAHVSRMDWNRLWDRTEPP